MFSLAIHSPSSVNIRNWRFVVIQDEELRKQIRQVAWNQEQITDASLLVVLCADLTASDRQMLRRWRSTVNNMRRFVVSSTLPYYDDFDQTLHDETMRACGIAAQILMAAAQSMGYDSCSVNGFDAEAIGGLINMPKDHAVCMLVAIGKAIDEIPQTEEKLLLEEVVVVDRF